MLETAPAVISSGTPLCTECREADPASGAAAPDMHAFRPDSYTARNIWRQLEAGRPHNYLWKNELAGYSEELPAVDSAKLIFPIGVSVSYQEPPIAISTI